MLVLGKLLVLGHPAELDDSRAKAFCRSCGLDCLDIFSSPEPKASGELIG